MARNAANLLSTRSCALCARGKWTSAAKRDRKHGRQQTNELRPLSAQLLRLEAAAAKKVPLMPHECSKYVCLGIGR